jgi:hypothetical protein
MMAVFKLMDGIVLAEACYNEALLEKVVGKAVYVVDGYPSYFFEKAIEPTRVYIEEDEDWEKVEVVVGWRGDTLPTSFEVEAEFVSWDELVFWPTITHYANLHRAGTLDTVLKEWKYIRRECDSLVDEMAKATLKLGTINGRVVDFVTLQVLAILAFLSMPPTERLSAVRSWYQRGENGAVEAISWLFQPNETAFLSPMASHGREQRVAFGKVRLVDGNWRFSSIHPTERGKEVDILVAAGFPVVPHDKMKYGSMSTASHLGDMRLFIPSGDMNKAEKVFDRRKLISGTSAQAVDEEASYLMIDDGSGPKPVTIGTRLKVGMSNAVAGIGLLSGGALARSDFRLPVWERRTYRAQVMADTQVKAKVGINLNPGDSVIGIEGIAVYNEPFPAEVVGVDVRKGEGETSWIHVTVRILVESSAPKLRAGGVKASVHRAMTDFHNDFLKLHGIDVLLGTEVLKNHLTLLQLWADTTRRCVVLTKAGLNEADEAAFNAWLDENIEQSTISAPCVEEIVPYVEAAGHTVVDPTNLGTYIVDEDIQLVCGELVCEVETPVTELRAVRTAPTFLAWATLAAQFKTDFAYHPQALYDLRSAPSLKMADTEEALGLAWREALELLASRYPAGCKIGNGAEAVNTAAAGREGVDPHVCFVDFKAMLAYSHGQIEGDDAMSIALHEVLSCKVKLNESYSAFKSELATYRQLRDASELLGHAIEYMRGATRSFALSGKLLRTLVNPARKATLLTVRGYNHIPVREVWVSPATAEKFNLIEGGLYWVGRFPGAALLPQFVKVIDGLDDGCIFLNSWSMQIGNKGDADGDQAYMFRHSDIGNMYACRWEDRDVVVRIMTMVLANQDTFIDANDAEAPQLEKWEAPRVDLDSWYKAAEAEYIRHSGVADSGLAGFFKKADLRAKLAWKNGVSGVIDLAGLAPNEKTGPVEALGEFATRGIGGCYATMHNLHVIEMAVSPSIKGHVASARRLAAALYEDYALSGYKAKKWDLHTTLKDTTVIGEEPAAVRGEKITKLLVELDAMGFSTGSDVKERRAVGAALFMARAIHAAYGQGDLEQSTINALTGSSSDWTPYVRLCQAFRSLTSGRGDLIVSPEEWDEVVATVPDGTPLSEVVGTIYDVYQMLWHTAATLAQKGEEGEEVW